MKRKKRKIMRRLVIDEVSAVDRPAQAGARALLMKHDEDGDPVDKRARLTTVVDGHQHLVMDNEDVPSGTTSWEADSQGRGHSHAFVREEDGTLTLSEALGHAHGVLRPATKGTRTTRSEEDEMTVDDALDEFLKADGSAELEVTEEEAPALRAAAADRLDAMARKRAEATGATFAKAYEEVLATPEGKELYDLHCRLDAGPELLEDDGDEDDLTDERL